MVRSVIAALVLVAGLIAHSVSPTAAPFAIKPGATNSGIILVQAINPGRDCQTIRTCNFRRGGLFRGCISTYSCRICRLVPAPCRVLGRERRCQRMLCGWRA